MNPRPTHRAVIDVGHKCNADCVICYHHHEKASWSFRPLLDLKREADSALARGNNYVDFTGGEPTLHPDIVELVKYVNSIGLKCCIITNALTRETRTTELIEAGVDDWLISIHGTEEIHNEIVQVERAREKQIRFLEQLVAAGRDFRFNCCMVKPNQNDLIATAKWMTQWKPRIVNWINMNPHHGWQSDIAGTQKIIADLDTLEAQLSQAIPVLLDAGIGVNVRYYPLCRLPEAFRMHVCNDYHVLFDNYEWESNVFPKTFKNFYDTGVKMSNSIEWKGQPCMQCNAKFMCGGPNSAFYLASGMKGVVPIKDETLPRDDFYYYRGRNAVCLTDRIPRKIDLCIAAIVDENMAAYVPLFLYCLNRAYPDHDVKVFARYRHHDEVKAIVDRSVGYGVYDYQVVRVDKELSHYGDNPNVTRAIRFVEFESYLKDYENVLWTDIDMLFHLDGDIVKFHTDKMIANGTQPYENFITNDQDVDRLCGVHFVTKDWWKAVSGCLDAARERIKNNPCPAWYFDKTNLMQIIDDSGLKRPPVTPSDLGRHHGVHMGGYMGELNGKGQAPVTPQITQWVNRLLSDMVFVRMAKDCGSLCENIAKVFEMWTNRFSGQPRIEQVPVVVHAVPEAKKKVPIKHYEGKLLIYTVCDKNYQWYIPMFLRSLELSKNLADVQIDIASEAKDVPIDNPACRVTGIDFNSGWSTAASRFLYEPKNVREYDYCLITDIDMLIHPEDTMSIVDQHMRHLELDGTECYENWISQKRGDEIRCPGVHFVTKDWWARTETARKEELELLLKNGTTEYCYDEFMIGRIIQKSGLPLPPYGGPINKLWRHHGVHLGDWRLNLERKIRVRPNVHQGMHIKTLLGDQIFMDAARECEKKMPFVGRMLKGWPKIFI